MKAGRLVLENGEILEGRIFGAGKNAVGRLVFDTRVVGYEEVLTDPCYLGKIVCFCYPLIGNYGINYEDSLTDAGGPAGIVVGELSPVYSNFRARSSLENFMKEAGICGISGIDTQYLTRKVREEGELWAGFACGTRTDRALGERIQQARESFPRQNLMGKAIEKKVLSFGRGARKVAVLNLGLTRREIEQFAALGISLKVFPPEKFVPEKVAGSFAGLYLTSGPEFPAGLESGAEIVRRMLGKIPILGYGLGHLLIGLALGGKISRSRVNHYGVNQPVQKVPEPKYLITEQAHSLVLENQAVADKVSYTNLNDGTIEGLEDRKQKVLSFSFKPEAGHFKQFASLLGGK